MPNLINIRTEWSAAMNAGSDFPGPKPEKRKKHRVAGRLAVGLTAALAATMVVAGPPASAAELPSTPSAANPSCIVYRWLDVQQASCYPSLTAAISAATLGRVPDAPSNGGDFTDATMAAINAAGTYFGQFSVQGRAILGINFDLTNYQGYSYITTSQAYYLCSPGGSNRLYKNVGHARSIMTFNRCGARVDGQTVLPAGYLTFANDKIADNGRPAGPAGNVIYSGAPTKEQALAYCASGASCAVDVDETSVSTRNGPQKSVGSKIVNCEPTPFTASYQETVATGGSMYIGHEISVSYSAGAPGAYQFELAYSLSFGKEWNWSTSVTKTYTVTAHQHRWVQLMVTTPMEDVRGDFDIKLPSGSPYRAKYFALKNAVMSHPDPNASPVFVQQGGTLTSAEIQQYCGSASQAARRAGTAAAPPGVTIIDQQSTRA